MLSFIAAALTLTLTDTLIPRAPEEVGMSSAYLSEIDRALRVGMEAGGFPGAAVVVVRRGAIVWERGVGRLGWEGDEPAVDPRRSMYDLASVTKVMATSLAVLLLHDDGALSLDDPVSRHLPQFAGGAKESVTVRQLLTHQGGLPSGIALRADESPPMHQQRILGVPMVGPAAHRPIYSDAGPMVLGLLVERVAGMSLDTFLERRAYAPLKLRSTRFRPTGAQLGRVAPTGDGAARGVVHDGNARALGGVAGHAGLFSSARDVAVFAQMVLNGGTYGGVRLLREETARAFVERVAGWRALGWSICHGGGSCGHRLSAQSYGHTGYSGASVWVDPERELIVVLLTNWVHRPGHSSADPIAVLADVRADVADLAVSAIIDDPRVPVSPPPAHRALLRVDRAAGWYTPVGP